MIRYLKCLWYIVKHKYYVFRSRRKYGCSLWRALVHDLTKLLPSEFLAYSRCFYDEKGNSQYIESEDMDHAWLLHQRRNKHHHQYWVLRYDSGKVIALEMPLECVKEMLADWSGASLACTGQDNIIAWYASNKATMLLHPNTERYIDSILRP